MFSRSRRFISTSETTVVDEDVGVPSVLRAFPELGRGRSKRMAPVRDVMTERSMTFSNSRTFPGQSYACSVKMLP